ncbi:MAG: signal peptidase II [Pseudomonadota bacterium]|nr:signal peptidase II [Pseudomonadota bacterium]
MTRKHHSMIDIRSHSLLFILIVIDLYSKHWALNQLMAQPMQLIPGWINFQLAFNYGTAFSLFSGASTLWHHLLTCLNALTIIGLSWWLFRYQTHTILRQWSLVLLISGGCGNFLNRWLHDYVVDFIALSIHGRNLFVCNIADIYISLGLMMLIYDQYITHE